MKGKNSNIFSNFYQTINHPEKRKFHRIRCDMSILCKNYTHPVSLQAKCTDISMGGMGIKMFSYNKIDIYPNDIMEIWIKLKEKDKPIHRWAKVVWFRQIDIATYRGGFSFMVEQPKQNSA